MNAATEVGSAPTSWIRLSESSTVLDSATTPQALHLPRYCLHPLKGDLRGLWSVTVRANWRIVFRFEGNHAFDVELIDYH
jgi:toxin HigB-1